MSPQTKKDTTRVERDGLSEKKHDCDEVSLALSLRHQLQAASSPGKPQYLQQTHINISFLSLPSVSMLKNV